jgi:hypothetical protein
VPPGRIFWASSGRGRCGRLALGSEELKIGAIALQENDLIFTEPKDSRATETEMSCIESLDRLPNSLIRRAVALDRRRSRCIVPNARAGGRGEQGSR